MQPPSYRNVCASPCVVVEECRPVKGSDQYRPFSSSKRPYCPEVSNSNRQNCSCGADRLFRRKPNHKHVTDSPYDNHVQKPNNRSVQFRTFDVGGDTVNSRADDTDTNLTDDDSSSSTSGSYTVGIEGDDALSMSVDV